MAPLDSLVFWRVLSNILLLVIAYFGIRMAYTSGQLPERQAKTEAELAARFAADMKQAADENRTDIEGHVRTLYARQQRDPNATLDFLLLSGGGDRGAFGTGFLLGWSTVASGANAPPKFDGVSGVSTGAFIAPFAFLGTHTDYEKIDRLLRNPQPDWGGAARHVFLTARECELSRGPRPRARPQGAGRPAVRRANRASGQHRWTSRAADSGHRHRRRRRSRLRCSGRRARSGRDGRYKTLERHSAIFRRYSRSVPAARNSRRAVRRWRHRQQFFLRRPHG